MKKKRKDTTLQDTIEKLASLAQQSRNAGFFRDANNADFKRHVLLLLQRIARKRK